MQSYGASNRSICAENFRDLEKTRSTLKTALPIMLLCKLVLVTTNIIKIHGKHPCKDGMEYNKTHVELRIIACTH